MATKKPKKPVKQAVPPTVKPVIEKPQPRAWERKYRPKKIEGMKAVERLDYLLWSHRSFLSNPVVKMVWLGKDLAKRGALLFALELYHKGQCGIDFVHKFCWDGAFQLKYYYMTRWVHSKQEWDMSWYRNYYLENRWMYREEGFTMWGLNKPGQED